MLEEMKKAGQCSLEKKIRKGEIICNYDGEVCTYKELKEKKIHVVWGWELHFRIQISMT